jgi:hypothetical protein
MTWIEFARQVFPDKSDEILDHLLWNKTIFPILMDRKLIYSQLMHHKVMRSIHWKTCELCGNPISTWMQGCCPQCHRALRRAA